MKKLLTLFAIFLGLGIANAQEKKSVFGYLEYHYDYSKIYYSEIFEFTHDECGDKTFITAAKEAFEKYLTPQFGFKVDAYGNMGFSYLQYGDTVNEGNFKTKEQAQDGRERAIVRVKSDITDPIINITSFTFTCNK
ncbi:hypothetical protein ACTS9T_14630 [Empedobacter falsenii]